MPFEEAEVTQGHLQQQQRCQQFAALAAESIGAAKTCLFSALPYEERVRQASGWYMGSADAMLHGNYAPLDEWIRRQCCLAAEQGFQLEDVVQLLRICRRSAMETEHWDEDIFSTVDEVINEVLRTTRTGAPWHIPKEFDYLTGAGKESEAKVDKLEANPAEGGKPRKKREDERRVRGRNRLELPIRVRGAGKQGKFDEITRTQNVSLGGLYFVSSENYQEGLMLHVTYPYWVEPGGINSEYPARVARLDHLAGGSRGIAVEFLKSLRGKPR